MPDLSTRYLGLSLKSPLCASSSPLTQDLGDLRRLEDAGAAAVVLHSLFEEQITTESDRLDAHLHQGAESYAEALSYYPPMKDYNLGPDQYLEHLSLAKQALSIPVIASLNGVSAGGWLDWAKKIEDAGADALELNTYFIATDPAVPGVDVEKMYLDLVRAVKDTISIPVAVKLSPFFSSMTHFCTQLDALGTDGICLFNRFYQPDFDIENLEVAPALRLSDSGELLPRLHWVALLHGRIAADLAITGGVHNERDVVKSMMAGARVAMMASALLRHGPRHLKVVEEGLRRWLEEHEYESIEMMQGSMSYLNVGQPAAFERANYMKVLGLEEYRPR